MKRRARWGASLAGAALLAGGVVAGTTATAQAATVTNRLTIKVCATGNYTAYAKIVGDGNNTDLTHVKAGSCFSDNIILTGTGSYDLWLFGLYNTTHKGFDVVAGGGPAGGGWNTGKVREIDFWTGGTTTAPGWSANVVLS
ncbi:hypothetical protein SAMN05446589_9549 [Streptomyces sp. OV198]|jgi:hypothetical protein|uniref:hypothetical protein n=1 Tax=Streptomyces sp. OV198 TaxID=1882787 RepID=UPI000BD52FD7|nr:hypothetical protein [Streptomyces sp. OV198]SOF02403.1 hypothetical protein SAMN05446589_9549 [Streptomyces sp. OV198]